MGSGTADKAEEVGKAPRAALVGGKAARPVIAAERKVQH